MPGGKGVCLAALPPFDWISSRRSWAWQKERTQRLNSNTVKSCATRIGALVFGARAERPRPGRSPGGGSWFVMVFMTSERELTFRLARPACCTMCRGSVRLCGVAGGAGLAVRQQQEHPRLWASEHQDATVFKGPGPDLVQVVGVDRDRAARRALHERTDCPLALHRAPHVEVDHQSAGFVGVFQVLEVPLLEGEAEQVGPAPSFCQVHQIECEVKQILVVHLSLPLAKTPRQGALVGKGVPSWRVEMPRSAEAFLLSV